MTGEYLIVGSPNKLILPQNLFKKSEGIRIFRWNTGAQVHIAKPRAGQLCYLPIFLDNF